MAKLRLLQINHVKLEGKFKLIFAELKWLQWKGCPLKALPSDFCPRELTVLDLSESKIERVWGWRWWNWYLNKVAENLMVINLLGCCNLTAIPDLSRHQVLEKLILERCTGLSKIHRSIGNASKLRYLNLRDCLNLVEFPSDVSGLKYLEILIFSGCSKLKELPEDMGSMKSIRKLLLDETAIEKLPESIFRLTKLERLSLNDCKSLKQLPKCFGKLGSLRELFLNDSVLEEMPDSIGSLAKLEKLSLMRCKMVGLPDSIGNLKLLTEFLLNGSSVRELPDSIGSLFFLKDLSVGNCKFLSKLPLSIGGLASIVKLQLDRTSITELPYQIGALKILEKLEMRNCTYLKNLPESIGSMSSLIHLIIVNAPIRELPESIGMLENLIMLRLNQCKELWRLPSSIGNLKSLQHLLMDDTAVTELPESFGALSSLMILGMGKNPWVELSEPRNPGAQEKPRPVVLPTSFSNLTSLKELNAHAWKISGKIPDDFEKLSSLEILNLGHNSFSSLPSSLQGLSVLQKLLLFHCKELKSLPPLPTSLEELNAAHCIELEYISDLSNLENLHELHLTNCEKLVNVPGLEYIKSLRRLYMSGCNASTSTIMRRLSKAAVKNLHNLSIPGSEIPNWFTSEMIHFSTRKNRAIKYVVIGVVISVNHQIPDDSRNLLPSIPDIQAKILELNQPKFTTVLKLMGIPRPNEDQIHLCRYPNSYPLVFLLKDGHKIQVAMRNPPYVKGVELKKCGIHLVFEDDDDDYDQEEESLDESQQSVSAKLTKFLASVEGGNHTFNFGYAAEHAVPEMKGSEERIEVPSLFYSFFPPLFLLLIWWLLVRLLVFFLHSC